MQLNLRDYVAYTSARHELTDRTKETYERALKGVDMDVIDSEKLEQVYSSLLKKLQAGTSYVEVNVWLALLSAWLKRNDQRMVKPLSYYELHDAIKSKRGNVGHYSDIDLQILFAAARSVDKSLWRLCLLCFYSGLRISAAHGVKWTDVERVPNSPHYTYRVNSKGKRYWAIISGRVYEGMLSDSKDNTKPIVFYDESCTTSFDQLQRKKLYRAIKSRQVGYLLKHENSDTGKIEKRAIFHSLRHSFTIKLLKAGLNQFDYELLRGNVPRKDVAMRYYVAPDAKEMPKDLVQRMADAYSKTELATMEIGLPARKVEAAA